MFVKDDLAKYRALKKVIQQGDYEIKGDAILAVASLLNWFNDLEKKIEEQIRKDSMPKITLPVKKKVKK